MYDVLLDALVRTSVRAPKKSFDLPWTAPCGSCSIAQRVTRCGGPCICPVQLRRQPPRGNRGSGPFDGTVVLLCGHMVRCGGAALAWSGRPVGCRSAAHGGTPSEWTGRCKLFASDVAHSRKSSMIHEVRYNGLMRHITYARLICSHSHGSTHSGNEGGREAKGALDAQRGACGEMATGLRTHVLNLRGVQRIRVALLVYVVYVWQPGPMRRRVDHFRPPHRARCQHDERRHREKAVQPAESCLRCPHPSPARGAEARAWPPPQRPDGETR